MSTGHRLRIDGREVDAPAGAHVAAALAQAGVVACRLSVSGEPRAPLCGMGVCRECTVVVDGVSRLACQLPCSDGLEVQTGIAALQPSGAVGARRRAPAAAATAASWGASNQVDLIVVGAGPAGLAAALAAAQATGSGGARIVVLDDNPAAGGQVGRSGVDPPPPAVRRALDALARFPGVRVLTGCRVVAAEAAAEAAAAGASAGDGRLHALLVEGPAGPRGAASADSQDHPENPDSAATAATATWWRAPRLVLASGARERFLPFPGWTLPGVTGAGGLQALIKGGLPVRGQRVVVAGSGPLLLAAAATATAAGAQVLRVAEQASRADVLRFAAGLWRWPAKARQALRLWPAGYTPGSWVLEALGEAGHSQTAQTAQTAKTPPSLRAVRLREPDGRVSELACDRLACGFGLVPNTELAERLGCTLQHGAVHVDERQATSVAGIYAAGECTGVRGEDAARVQGTLAGQAAVGQARAAGTLPRQRRRAEAFGAALERCFALRDELRTLPESGTWVCRCEDVPHSALAGHAGWTEAKLATRCGMGPCQGRVCGPAAQFLYGWAPPRAGWLVAPVSLGTLAASVAET